MRKTAYHHGDLRRALLTVARSHIEASGVERLSIKAISRELGVTHAAAYKHFSNKADLIQSVSDEGMLAFAQSLIASQSSDSAEADYYATARGVLAFAIAHPKLYTLIFGTSRRDTAESLQAAGEESAFAVIRGRVVSWQAEGWLEEGDPLNISMVLWAAIHGVAMLVCTGRLALSAEEAADLSDATMRAMREGLRSQG